MKLYLLAFLCTAAVAETASAQPADTHAPTDGSGADPTTTVDTAELQALLQAVADDAGANVSGAPAASPAPSTAPSFLDLALILDVAAAYFDNVADTWAGGHDPARNGFTLQQLELSAAAAIDPFFRLDSNVVFSEEGVEIEEAYATTTALPGRLQVRAGQFLSPVGRANPTHPHTWNFTDQSLVVGRFLGGEGMRGLGGEVSWLSPLPWFAELVGAVQFTELGCCAHAGAHDETDADDAPGPVATGALRQFFSLSPAWSLLTGLSYATEADRTRWSERAELFGADFYLKWRPVGSPQLAFVGLQVEAMNRRRHAPTDMTADWGGYAELTVKPLRRWAFSARHELVTATADEVTEQQLAELTQRASLAASFFPSHFSRVRVQGSLVDRDGEIGWGAITQLEVIAGAHGAHSF